MFGRLIPWLCLSVVLGCSHGSGDAEPGESDAVVTVRTVAAEERAVAETVEALGRSEALPQGLVTLTPAVQGHVQEIVASLGQPVAKNDPIVVLDLTAANADAAEKQAQRDTLKSALDLLQAEPRPEDRKGLEIAVRQAKLAVERAQLALDRLKPLRARNEVSEAHLIDAGQLLSQARLQQQTAEAQLELLVVGPRPEAVAEAQARLAAADEALALSRANRDLHTIRSPIDGVLDSLSCHLGQALAIGAPIGEIVDTRRLNVVAWLSPASAARIHLGDTARVSLADAKPRRAGDDAKADNESDPRGKVEVIGRVADPQTGNLPIRVLVDNPRGKIAVGETLNLSIVISRQKHALAVPTAAVMDLGEGPLVLVVRQGKIVHLQPTSATARGDWTVISGTDLEPGEPVVTEGGFNLPKDTPVKIEPVELPKPAAVAEAPHE